MHVVSSSESNTDQPHSDTVLHMQDRTGLSDVLILVGHAHVLNPKTKALEEVHILLDTGADRTFVSNTLAERLQLQEVYSRPLTITTFGTTTPVTKTCGMVNIRLWDQRGNPHSYSAAKMDVLTEPMQRSRLSMDDKKFLVEEDIQLSINPSTVDVHPQILLGCADVFTLLDGTSGTYLTLPSGIRIMPSKLGYLVVGQTGSNYSKKKGSVHMTRSLSLYTVEIGANVKTEEESDEKEDTLISTANPMGLGRIFALSHPLEFTNFPGQPRKSANAHVQLLETIRGHDSTGVPQHPSELELGIIEEVKANKPPDGARIHYLAHQVIITPHKETTKLRVVLDASAHQKKRNSLNDVLHKKPFILPSIFDMLLRLRIGNVALTSDVEKASLQYCLDDKNFAQSLQENTYVDNVTLAASSIVDVLRMYQYAKGIFNDANMNLREFRSNHKDVNDGIEAVDLSKNAEQKVLGLLWDTEDDSLTIALPLSTKAEMYKTDGLRTVASVYDPHGWLSPLTLAGKIFFQQLWRHNYEWDTHLSTEHQLQWDTTMENCNGYRRKLKRCLADFGEAATLLVSSDARRVSNVWSHARTSSRDLHPIYL